MKYKYSSNKVYLFPRN